MIGLISNQEKAASATMRGGYSLAGWQSLQSPTTLRAGEGARNPHTLPGQGSSVAQVSERPSVHTLAQGSTCSCMWRNPCSVDSGLCGTVHPTCALWDLPLCTSKGHSLGGRLCSLEVKRPAKQAHAETHRTARQWGQDNQDWTARAGTGGAGTGGAGAGGALTGGAG